MKTQLLALTASGAMMMGTVQAAVVNIDSYTFNSLPNGAYPDSGGELTDGVELTNVWGSGIQPTTADVTPLVGWFNTDADVLLNFASTETINSVEIWMADSDGNAAVSLPSTVTLSSGAFSQTFNVTNPATTGSTVAIYLSGFSVTTNSLRVQATRSDQWTMFSEINVSTAPEPSATALLGLGGLSLLLRRRR